MGVTTVTLRAAAVTRTVQAKPSRAFASASQSVFFLKGGGSAEYGLVQFGLPRDLPGTTVLSAKIRLAARDAGASGVVSAQALGAGFRNSTTWRNQPPVASGSSPVAGVFEPGQNVWREIDVTADLNAVAQGRPYFGHRLTIDVSAARAFRSRTNARLYPRLVLTYATETPAPQKVQPSGVTALAAPTFSWAVGAGVSKVQGQAATVGAAVSTSTGGFVSPSWTSAELASTIGLVNTAAAGFPGLADGAAADFQFRQFGPLGWGKWSTPVTVSRDAYETLTPLEPVPDGVTNDPTPPHSWSFAGQSKFRLWVYFGAKVLYDSGEVPGDDTEWTPTLNTVGVPDGAGLRSLLRVWDGNAARVASPGDPGFVEASWSWTFNSSLDTPAPVNFSASVDADRPLVHLRWGYSGSIPDEFVVERDGVLTTRFDAAEAEVSNNRWEFSDATCPPNTQAVYRVRAVINNKVSQASPAQLVEVRATGVTVIDADSGVWFNVAGEDASNDLDLVESVQTFKGPYAQGSIKRVLALGGIEGAVSGVLHRQGDRPLRDQVEAAKWVRSHPTRVYRLVYGWVNVPVVVSGLSVMLDGSAMLDESVFDGERDRHMTHRISFDVDQVGEFETDPDGEE